MLTLRTMRLFTLPEYATENWHVHSDNDDFTLLSPSYPKEDVLTYPVLDLVLKGDIGTYVLPCDTVLVPKKKGGSSSATTNYVDMLMNDHKTREGRESDHHHHHHHHHFVLCSSSFPLVYISEC